MLGFGGIAGAAVSIAKLMVFIALVLFVDDDIARINGTEISS